MLGLCCQIHTGGCTVTSQWLHMQFGAQKNSEPSFSRVKNPEERRLILEKGDKILKREYR